MTHYNTRKLYEKMKEKFEYEEAVKEFYEKFDKIDDVPVSGLDLNKEIDYYYEWGTD